MLRQRVRRNDPCTCGSGRKFKVCCMCRFAPEAPALPPAVPRPRVPSGDGAVLRPTLRPQPSTSPSGGKSVKRIPVHYTYDEPFGAAECVYCFPVNHLFILESGNVVRADWLQAGARFRMEDGAWGTVTAVEPPKVWGPPNPVPDKDGNYERRVLGTIKHKGHAVIDVRFGGQTITGTPDHLWYSASRKAWVPAQTLQRGELLFNTKGTTVPVESVSEPRHGFVELFNLEVEELHTFFVGDCEIGSALVHNGQGNYIKKPMGLEQAHPDLPVRTSGPTRGLINGKPVVSGTHGGIAQEVFGPKLGSLSKEAKIALTHVEGHAAAEVVKGKLPEAVLFINYASGPCKHCKAGVPELLDVGQKLWVVFPRGVGFFTNGGWTRL